MTKKGTKLEYLITIITLKGYTTMQMYCLSISRDL